MCFYKDLLTVSILTVSLLMFWNITQTYKHTPPPPHSTPFPQRGEVQSPLFGGEGGGGGVGWGGRMFIVVYTSV